MQDTRTQTLLTIKQAAKRLACSEANLYAFLEQGQLPYLTIGKRKGYRIDPPDLDDFIKNQKVQRDASKPRSPRPRLKHIKLK